jgi:hypothetical protein
LRPYFFWRVQDGPGVYLFVSKVPGAGDDLQVDYVGQAAVVCRRVRFGSHHRLSGEYQPDLVLYLPLPRADSLVLTAAEKPQAYYPSRRRWVGTRRIGYHRRDGVARAGRLVPATAGRTYRRNRMSDTTRLSTPPRA